MALCCRLEGSKLEWEREKRPWDIAYLALYDFNHRTADAFADIVRVGGDYLEVPIGELGTWPQTSVRQSFVFWDELELG
jgi:hypothetical protein